MHMFIANANLKENKLTYISNLQDGMQHARKIYKQNIKGSILPLHMVIRSCVL